MAPTKLQQAGAGQALGTYAQATRTSKAIADQAGQTYQTVTHKGPWPGFQPDVDPDRQNLGGALAIRNLLARPVQARGEILTLPDGFQQLDPARLPLGDGATLPANPTTDGKAICRLDQMLRYSPLNAAGGGEFTGEYILTPLTVTAGDGSTGGSGNMYRIQASGQWGQVAESVACSTTRALSADIDGRDSSFSMGDSCVAPFGATARDTNTAAGNDDLQSGPINQPAWIYTNDQDEVMVFPATDGVHTYEPLCDETSSPDLDGGTTDGFKCKSVETWNGRVYFLNTSENGIRFNRRLRRTAKFTCDPDPTITGAGHFDFQQFQGEGLRIESIGDVLAAYFSDGIGFVYPTGNANTPDDPRELTNDRGLLSTHSMCRIDRTTHFVIATDGWWLLDASGRFQELGVVNLDGIVLPKWREYFYRNIDMSQRHRVQVYYDQPSNYVYIIYPRLDVSPVQEVWIYDIDGDRVFIENYPVSCFAGIDPQVTTGTVWDAMSGVWNDELSTWDSFEPRFGTRSRVHGDTSGYVYLHQRNLYTYDTASNPAIAQAPAWSFETGLHHQDDMRYQLTLDRLTLQYFAVTASTPVTVTGISGDGTSAGQIVALDGTGGSLLTRDAWFRLTGQGLSYRISGSGRVEIHGVITDLFADPIEVRRS